MKINIKQLQEIAKQVSKDLTHAGRFDYRTYEITPRISQMLSELSLTANDRSDVDLKDLKSFKLIFDVSIRPEGPDDFNEDGGCTLDEDDELPGEVAEAIKDCFDVWCKGFYIDLEKTNYSKITTDAYVTLSWSEPAHICYRDPAYSTEAEGEFETEGTVDFSIEATICTCNEDYNIGCRANKFLFHFMILANTMFKSGNFGSSLSVTGDWLNKMENCLKEMKRYAIWDNTALGSVVVDDNGDKKRVYDFCDKVRSWYYDELPFVCRKMLKDSGDAFYTGPTGFSEDPHDYDEEVYEAMRNKYIALRKQQENK